MSIMLVGGLGYLGRGLAPALGSELGHEVKIVDFPRSLFDLGEDDLAGFDAVVNLSVFADRTGSIGLSRKGQAWKVNVDGVSHLQEICDKTDTCLVQLSTRECHGLTFSEGDVYLKDGVFRPKLLIGEDVPYKPTSEYGRSKLVAEWICLSSPVGYVVRLGTPYTDEIPPTGGGLIVSLVRDSVVKGIVELDNGGRQFRDPLHVLDLASLISRIIAERPRESLFNAAYGGENLISLREIVHLANPDAQVIERVGRGDYGFAMDTSRALNELGWQPKITVRGKIEEFARILAAGGTPRQQS